MNISVVNEYYIINVIFEIKIHFNLRNMLRNKTKYRKLGVLCPLYVNAGYTRHFIKGHILCGLSKDALSFVRSRENNKVEANIVLK